MKEKDLIDGLFNENSKHDAASQRSARQLLHSEEALGGDKFVNELIQNADDEGYICKDGCSIRFLVSKNYLVVEHDGNPFTEGDVKGICDVGDPNRNKVKNIHKTGNKGLGFKSVFLITKLVRIISGKYDFSFQEDYELWKNNSTEYQWQICPIWTAQNDIPDELKNIIRKEKTIFIFKLETEVRERVVAGIKRFIGQPKNLVFLRHTKEIIFQNTLTNKIQSIKKLITNEKVEIQTSQAVVHTFLITINNKETSKWLVYEHGMKIPAEITEKIKLSKLIPLKYKEKNVEIVTQLAIEVKEGALVPAEFPQIYTLLPTDEKIPALPFVINSEFVLDIARAHLQNNFEADEWNTFIFSNAFYIQFQFAAYLATSDYWRDVLTVLIDPNKLTFPHLEDKKPIFRKSFEKGLKSVPVVKNLNETTTHVISEKLRVDTYGFIEEFFTDKGKETCAHNEIKDLNKLISFGATEFTVKNITEIVKSKAFLERIKLPEGNLAFIRYLAELVEQLEQDEQKDSLTFLFKELGNLEFILSSNKNKGLIKYSDIYFPQEHLMYAINKCDFINIVHPLLFKDETAKAFLEKKQRISSVQLSTVVQKANEAPDEIIKFTRNIADRKFSREELAVLSNLKVKTKTDKYVPANEANLSNAYKPKDFLETHFSSYPNYVSEEYLDERLSGEQWHDFFCSIGVHENLNKNNIKYFVEEANCISGNEELDPQVKNSTLINFTRFIFNEFYCENNEPNSVFEEELKEEVQALNFLTVNKTFFKISAIYLSDFYAPPMPLQDKVKTLNYLSSQYIPKNSNNIELWKNFFINLGVKAKINFTPVRQIARINLKNDRYPLSEEYLNYLGSGNLKKDPACGKLPCKPEAMKVRFFPQHSLSHYFDIEFIDQILNTSVFWKSFIDYWLEIKANTPIIYSAWGSARQVPSNIQYLVWKLMQDKYQLKPEQLYTNTVKNILGEDADHLSIAELPVELAEEQIEYLEFRLTLTIADCLSVLLKISQRKLDQNSLDRIAYIYKSINENLENDPHLSLSHEKVFLPNQCNEFVEVSGNLFALISKHVLLGGSHPKLLKKIEKLDKKAFEKVSRFLGVTLIKDSDLKTVYSHVELKDKFNQNLKEKIIYIVLVQSHKEGKIDESAIKEYSKSLLNILSKKLEELKCYSTEKLEVSYESVFKEKIDIWFDKNTSSLYWINLENPLTLQKAYKYIFKYLKLTFSKSIFLDLLFLSPEEIHTKYAAYNISAENVNFLHALMSPAENTSKMEIDEHESEEVIEENDVNSQEMQELHSPDEAEVICSSNESKQEEDMPEIHEGMEEGLEQKKRPCPFTNDGTPPKRLKESVNTETSVEKVTSLALLNESSQEDQILETEEKVQQEFENEDANFPTENLKENTNNAAVPLSVNVKPKIKTEEKILSTQNFSSLSQVSSSSTSILPVSSPNNINENKQEISPPPTQSQKWSNSYSKISSLTSEENRRKIGRAAEKYKYDEFEEKNKKKYDKAFHSNNAGFVIEKENYKKTFIWFNKGRPDTEDAGENHDMHVTVEKNLAGKKILKETFIEIKGSMIAQEEINVTFSEGEWALRQEVKEQENKFYKVYTVNNIINDRGIFKPSAKTQSEKIKDLDQQIAQGKISVQEVIRTEYKVTLPCRGK